MKFDQETKEKYPNSMMITNLRYYTKDATDKCSNQKNPNNPLFPGSW